MRNERHAKVGIKQVGRRVVRREDPELVTGSGKYTADLQPGPLFYLTLVRSPYAHARILEVMADDARALEGVVAILTAQDVNPNLAAPLWLFPFGDPYKDVKPAPRYPLAEGKVRHVGEPVVAILSDSPAVGMDAADLVWVDYEPLEAAVNIEDAIKPGAPLLYEEHGSNVAFTLESGAGDIDVDFASAAHIVELKGIYQRVVGHAMEPRATIASYDEASGITVWTSTQSPHLDKMNLSASLGIPAERIRVIAPEVGGGFGVKSNSYREVALAAFLAKKFGHTIKWTATRSEDFLSTVHGRGQTDWLKIAADADGKILAADFRFLYDCGGYYSRVTSLIAKQTPTMVSNAYAIPTIRTHGTGVFTNKLSNEPYRGAGRPEPIYMMERAITILAARMGLDPLEIRQKNLIPADQFPYQTPVNAIYDSGNYQAAVDKLLTLVDYQALRKTQADRRRAGKLMGIGTAFYVEVSAGGAFEYGGVEIDAEAKVVLKTGSSPHGQGHETTWAQIAADVLQISSDDMVVIHDDTDIIPRGIGTFASRSTALAGSAIFENAEVVRDKAKEIAAHLLEAATADVELVGGAFQVKGAPDQSLRWSEIAAAAYSDELPSALAGGLMSEGDFRPKNMVYGYGIHLCVVDIDPATGEVKITRYLCVDDCGNIINPMIVDGQIHGGIAQGIGEALYENAYYDDDGNLLAGTLLDYTLPRADTTPTYETHHTTTPTDLNPLGAKGVGEGGTLGAIPATANAVHDAIAHFGVEHIDLPLSAEKIYRAINNMS